MSDRNSIIAYTSVAICLAVHLGREELGLSKTAERISRDVDAIVRAGIEVRLALDLKNDPEAAYGRVQGIADHYGAELVRSGEVEGVALGLRFWGARSKDLVFRVS